jgi:hypothetical protein
VRCNCSIQPTCPSKPSAINLDSPTNFIFPAPFGSCTVIHLPNTAAAICSDPPNGRRPDGKMPTGQ